LEALRSCFKGLINLYIRPPTPQDGGLRNGLKSPILGDLGGECKALKLFKQSLTQSGLQVGLGKWTWEIAIGLTLKTIEWQEPLHLAAMQRLFFA
jgi:hypothetical protein